MGDRDELERALCEHWTRDNLTVYADLLQALDDPRGELIIIQQRVDADGGTSELRARRDELLVRWLGPRVAHDFGWYAHNGFVDEIGVIQWRLIDTPLGAFVRRCKIAGVPRTLFEQLVQIAREPRPWLLELELDVDTWSRVAEPAPSPEDWRAIAHRLLAVAPRLRALRLSGAWLPGFEHAAIRTLRLDMSAANGLASSGAVLPFVTSFALDIATRYRPDDGLVPKLLAAQLPALARLDLTPNEDSPGVRDAMFRWLATTELLPRLTALVAPSPRLPIHVAALRTARARFAGTLTLPRAYSRCPIELDATAVPALRPWPPYDAVEDRVFEVVVDRYTPDRIGARDLVRELETCFDRFTTADLVAWDKFWAVADQLDRVPKVQLAFAIVLRAFASLDGLARSDRVKTIVTRLHEIPSSNGSVALSYSR